MPRFNRKHRSRRLHRAHRPHGSQRMRPSAWMLLLAWLALGVAGTLPTVHGPGAHDCGDACVADLAAPRLDDGSRPPADDRASTCDECLSLCQISSLTPSAEPAGRARAPDPGPQRLPAAPSVAASAPPLAHAAPRAPPLAS